MAISPTPDQEGILKAVLGRLIPRDKDPGAIEAGVHVYILSQLKGDLAEEARDFWRHLDCFGSEAKARLGTNFSALTEPQQDELLAAWELAPEHASFFSHLVDLAAEGFYADPANGGNAGECSWKMVGYDPRRPARVSAP